MISVISKKTRRTRLNGEETEEVVSARSGPFWNRDCAERFAANLVKSGQAFCVEFEDTPDERDALNFCLMAHISLEKLLVRMPVSLSDPITCARDSLQPIIEALQAFENGGEGGDA